MDQKKINWLAAGMMAILLLAACSAAPSKASPTPYPQEVEWETAVQILNSGNVETVVQLHSLDVTLTMKDGSQIHTVEPTIDTIFDEIEKCGNPCSDIVMATE